MEFCTINISRVLIHYFYKMNILAKSANVGNRFYYRLVNMHHMYKTLVLEVLTEYFSPISDSFLERVS